MAKRVRPPMVSLAMFLIVCSMAWVLYENRDMLDGFGGSDNTLDRTTREQLQERIYKSMESDACFAGLRSNISWRPREKRYRLDIEVVDGDSCEARARALCEQVARMIEQETDVVATVTAYDGAGREIGRCVL